MQYWGGVPKSPNSKWLRTLRIVEKCTECGWKNAVVFSEKPHSADLMEPFLDAGADMLLHNSPPGSINLNAILDTYRFLHLHPCDLFHCHNRPANPLLAAALNRVPVRFWSRLAMSSNYERGVRPIGIHKLQPNLRLSCFLSDKILCVSQPVLDELIGLCRFVKNKSAVVGAAVDLDFYSSGCSNNIRKEFFLSKDHLIFVSIGHAVPVKGWDVLLRAYAKFQKSFPRSRLLLVGSIDDAVEKDTLQLLQQLIQEFSLNENVILTGKRNDIQNILASADIYIQSSRSEGLCGALLEALAAGLPCIASNVGGTTDVIRSRENGLLFEREDVDGLVKKMLILAQHTDLREKIAANAFPSVQRYRLETVTDVIVKIYSELLISRGLI